MIGLLGYNFFGDGNSLDPVPTNINNINSAMISNGIYDHLNIDIDVTNNSQTIPTSWQVGYIINAAFNGNLAGGSLDELAGDISGYKVKRRKLGEFEWITIYQKEISTPEELSFAITDNLAQNNVEYEYAFVPLLNGQEGQYVIHSVLSKFNGVFFADNNTIFKLDADVSYGSTTSNQKIGIYEPMGRKYPVVVSNGLTSYEKGSVTGTILQENYDPTKPIDRQAIKRQRDIFVAFLNNKMPKIIKDWNSNIWLCMTATNPSTEYLVGSGMGMVAVTNEWVEVGDSNDRQDLYDCGLIPTAD